MLKIKTPKAVKAKPDSVIIPVLSRMSRIVVRSSGAQGRIKAKRPVIMKNAATRVLRKMWKRF